MLTGGPGGPRASSPEIVRAWFCWSPQETVQNHCHYILRSPLLAKWVRAIGTLLGARSVGGSDQMGSWACPGSVGRGFFFFTHLMSPRILARLRKVLDLIKCLSFPIVIPGAMASQ